MLTKLLLSKMITFFQFCFLFRKKPFSMFSVVFLGQLNDTQQELKENNELVVELQGNLHLKVFLLYRPGCFFNFLLGNCLKTDKHLEIYIARYTLSYSCLVTKYLPNECLLRTLFCVSMRIKFEDDLQQFLSATTLWIHRSNLTCLTDERWQV